MKNDFKHKVVVITGATGGIGRALSSRFATAGARVVLIDIDEAQLQALQNQLERSAGGVMSQVCDIADADRCEAVMQEVVNHYGGIDVLINNAGIVHYSLFRETEMAVIRRVMEVNFFGALNCTKAALDMLVERKGMVITLSSVLGLSPMICYSGYSASKHALHGFFDSLRAELLAAGVHVMIACPGRTETDMQKVAMGGDGNMVSREGAAKNLATPNDVAESIFRAAQKNKRLVIHSNTGKLTQLLYRCFPRYYEHKTLRPLIKKMNLQ